MVVDAEDRPVAGAGVQLHASGWIRREAQTGTSGEFEFRELPPAFAYSIGASLPASGVAEPVDVTMNSPAISLDGMAPKGAVRLKLLPMYYQAVDLVDESDHALDLRGAEILCGGWGLLYMSHFPDASVEPQIRTMGVAVPLRPGRVAFFWSVPRPDKKPANVPVSIPGYMRAVLPLRWRPISEWPSADRAVLVADAKNTLKTVVVEFPRLRPERASPADLGLLPALDLKLRCSYVRSGEPREQTVWRDRNVLYVDDLDTIRVQRLLGDAISYEVERDKAAGTWIVRPNYPEWGYLDVRLANRGDPSAGRWYLTLKKGATGNEPAPTPTPVQIGDLQFLFGPLAPGEYLVRRHLPGDDQTRSPGWGHEMRVELTGGIHVVEWE